MKIKTTVKVDVEILTDVPAEYCEAYKSDVEVRNEVEKRRLESIEDWEEELKEVLLCKNEEGWEIKKDIIDVDVTIEE